ncbi:MAG TPA: GAF domain-containing protein [Anaerolineales bacterium]|nr:GAF domain-containing protein [Anaerolineales bacterium]
MSQDNRNLELQIGAWRAGFLRVTLMAACLFGLVALIPAVLYNPPLYKIMYLVLYAVVLLITFYPFAYQVKAYTLIMLLYALAISGLLESGIRGDARVFAVGTVAVASLLLNWRTGGLATALYMLTYLIFGWLILNNLLHTSNSQIDPGGLSDWLTGSTSVLLLCVLIVNGVRHTHMEFSNYESYTQKLLKDLSGERELLEQRVEERTASLDKRTAQLKAVAEVGKSITSYRNLSDLLQQAAYLIHENFGFYHVGIFLLDSHKEYAILTATNSEGGRRMLEKRHQLKVGETGIVGYVAEHLKARIALDVGEDAVFFNNPDLPDTRSEMALPLVASGQILGVLDVQSHEPQAFTEEDVVTIQTLAEQIAVAIQNANLFSETEKALEAARGAYGELSREAWTKILRSQPRVGFIATSPSTIQASVDNIDPSLAKAIDTGDLILSPDGMSISVPIKIRGQSIGAIRLKKPEIAETWSQDETNLAIALSDQLSGALESARLYRESQQRAARESLVSDISARLSAASQVETIIRETVQELGEAIGDASITFQILDSVNGQDPSAGFQGGFQA